MALNIFKIREKTDKSAEVYLDDLWGNTVSAKMTLEEKIEQLFEQFREPIFRYLVVTFGNKTEAEDITQEAFIKLYYAFKEGKQIDNLKSWLYRIAHNLAIDQIRHQQFVSPLGDMEWSQIAESLPDLDSNPEEKLLKLERRERLHKAMQVLTAQERQCLNLRAAGFRYREIAEIMNIGVPTVGEYLKRGINKITK